MRITRAMAAAAVAAALTLAGCSSGGETDAAGSQGGSSSGTDASTGGAAGSGAPSTSGPGTGQSGDGSASGNETGSGSVNPSASGSGQAAPTPEVDDVPDVVATVNGEDIDRDEFVSAYKSQFQQAAMQQQASGGDVDQAKLKKQVADQLVNNKLFLQAADKAGIKASDKDIQDTLDEAAQQNGLDSADDLISAMKQQGVSSSEIHQEAASQYKVTTYIDKKADISDPTDKELHERYDQLVDQMDGSDDSANGSSDGSSSGPTSSGAGKSSGSGESAGSDEGSGSGATSGSGDSSANIPDFDDVRDQLAQQIKSEKQGKAASKILDKLRDKADISVNLD